MRMLRTCIKITQPHVNVIAQTDNYPLEFGAAFRVQRIHFSVL